jgi:AraC-like DNA-binding protein
MNKKMKTKVKPTMRREQEMRRCQMQREKKIVSYQLVEYVMKATDEEFAEFSVGTLAHTFNIDRFKLLRQFKKQTNMTLEHFLYKEKMTRAAFLLKAYHNITIKQVAKKIGFCTCDYFIQKFKKYYGVAPGKYREFKWVFPRDERRKKPGNSLEALNLGTAANFN